MDNGNQPNRQFKRVKIEIESPHSEDNSDVEPELQAALLASAQTNVTLNTSKNSP